MKADGKVENQEQVFHFPTAAVLLSQNKKEPSGGWRRCAPRLRK
jgi:hypothetical protein